MRVADDDAGQDQRRDESKADRHARNRMVPGGLLPARIVERAVVMQVAVFVGRHSFGSLGRAPVSEATWAVEFGIFTESSLVDATDVLQLIEAGGQGTSLDGTTPPMADEAIPMVMTFSGVKVELSVPQGSLAGILRELAAPTATPAAREQQGAVGDGPAVGAGQGDAHGADQQAAAPEPAQQQGLRAADGGAVPAVQA